MSRCNVPVNWLDLRWGFPFSAGGALRPMIYPSCKLLIVLQALWLVMPCVGLAIGPAPYLRAQPGPGDFFTAQDWVTAQRLGPPESFRHSTAAR